MAQIAIPAMIAGTALQATSQYMAGREQARAAAHEEQQLRAAETNTRIAAAQDEAQRRSRLTDSLETIAVIRGGRGVGEGSPTGDAIYSSVIEDQERDISTSRYNFLSKADTFRLTADMAKRKAQHSMLAGILGAGASVATGTGNAISPGRYQQR